MEHEREYLSVEFRSVDDDQRIIEGVANSARVDSFDSVIEPGGAVVDLPIPLFWHAGGKHDHGAPIGEVIATELRGGMRWFRAQVRKIADDGTEGGRSVKHRVDAAWSDIKNRLVRGVSIEFIPIEPRSNNAKRWTRWRWMGLACTPVPSNIDATILNIRAAFGAPPLGSPGASGVSASTPNPRPHPMTIIEQITQHENSRAAKVARKGALMESASARGETLNETEAQEFDGLEVEIRSHDGHLTRLSSLKRDNEAAAVAAAVPVPIRPGLAPAAAARAGSPVVRVQSAELPGLGMARYAMSLLSCRGNRFEAAEYAKRTFGDGGEEIALHLRAAIAPGTTLDATWARPLVPTTFLAEFLELLRPATIIGRIPGLRKVPFNISMPTQTAGGTYGWVGEGKPKPVTNMQFAAVTLGMAKAAGIIVLTNELVRSSQPSAQQVVRDELVKGITAFLDVQFIDPAVAAVANVNPASITNGVAGTVASGVTPAAAMADLGVLIKSFVTANLGVGGVVLLMNEGVAFTLGMMRNAVGAPEFPGITATGGTILGIPVVTSNAIGDQIIAVHAPSVLLADDGGVEIDVSTEASLQMDSAPTDPVAAATVMISLWQQNLVGLRAERFINWAKARTGAVNRTHTVAYV